MSTYPELTTIDKADVVDWVFEKNVRPFFRVLKGKNGMLQKVIPDFESSGKRKKNKIKAEYRAMASTVSEVLWDRWLLGELRVDTSSPTPLFCDNQAACHIANNPVFHERTKHVEMDCYFVRERVESKEIIPMYISSKMQVVDLLTKGLTAQQLQFLLGKISIANLHANLDGEYRI
nr:putative reverse transcriptase, RNA-dependent DNA polymerase, Gag-polypeptide of LTR copia-type [Tanacetum cinerariifolium]